MDDFKELLRKKGFRATLGRIALLRTVWNAKRPLSVDEIGRTLNLNVATLYRALNDLAEEGLLLRGGGIGDAVHFSYPKNHHHHMVCTGCGSVARCLVC